jgi:hypothetical protein
MPLTCYAHGLTRTRVTTRLVTGTHHRFKNLDEQIIVTSHVTCLALRQVTTSRGRTGLHYGSARK